MKLCEKFQSTMLIDCCAQLNNKSLRENVRLYVIILVQLTDQNSQIPSVMLTHSQLYVSVL